jgi:hypothetical protein
MTYLDSDKFAVELLKSLLGDDVPLARNHFEDELHNKNKGRHFLSLIVLNV